MVRQIDGNVSDSLVSPSMIKERASAYELQRSRDAAKHDAQLRKLLRFQQVKPQVQDEQLNIAQRRAAYEAQRMANQKLRLQRAEEARSLVRERLEGIHAQSFIDKVIAMVLAAANLNADVGVGCDVDLEMLNGCCERAKRDAHKQRLDAALLSKSIKSAACREEVTDRILDVASMNDLVQAESDQYSMLICDAVKHLQDSMSPHWTCSICLDPMASISEHGLDMSNMWCAPLRRNEHWSNYACGHTFCRACMETWTETAVNEQKMRIKCPAEGCTYSLWEQDLKELLSVKVFKRYQEHKHADYLQNLRAISEHDDSLMRWLRQHARPCPDCHVIVSRSEGCNVMTCVCGTRFCYSCGFKGCQCSQRERPNIWKPQA
jgi:hypothetical protein